MAVERQANILGQQRIDIPHIRAIESAVAADFDLLAGQILAGKNPLIITGFDVIPLSPGASVINLQINVANAVILHPLASENGTIFSVPSDRAPETLNAANTRVSGGFSAGTINYIGIDLRRAADSTTSDLVQFLDPDTNLEKPKTVPLARTLDYIIIISTQDFSTIPGIMPLAKVTTDSFNNIVSIEDARNFFMRLGIGGTITDVKNSYQWPGGRTEAGDNSDFTAGDKKIASLKEWMDAVMTRLWEEGGGEYWYSATADRNVTMSRTGYQGSVFANGEYFEWDGTNLHWKGLKFLFDNSTGWYNEVKAQTTTSAGLTNLADGDCLYIDLDRTQNRTGGAALQPVKHALSTLGPSTIPGARQVIAWRTGTEVFTRNMGWAVGTSFLPATDTSYGVVKLTIKGVSFTVGDGINSFGEFNGTTFAPIQAALNAITSSGAAKGTIYIKKGTYSDATNAAPGLLLNLTAASNIRIYGDGPDLTILNYTGDNLAWSILNTAATKVVLENLQISGDVADSGCISINGTTVDYSTSHCKIIGPHLFGAAPTGTHNDSTFSTSQPNDSNYNGALFDDTLAQNTFTNCTFIGTGPSVSINTGLFIGGTDCAFYNCSFTCVYNCVYGGWTNTVFNNCKLSATNGGGFDFNISTNVDVVHCTMNTGAQLRPSCTNTTIRDCTFETTYPSAITVYGSSGGTNNIKILNNTLHCATATTGNTSMIYAEVQEGLVIDGNRLTLDNQVQGQVETYTTTGIQFHSSTPATASLSNIWITNNIITGFDVGISSAVAGTSTNPWTNIHVDNNTIIGNLFVKAGSNRFNNSGSRPSYVNNDHFTITDNINTPKTFEYKVDGSYVAVGGRFTIDISALTGGAAIINAGVAVVNAQTSPTFLITASNASNTRTIFTHAYAGPISNNLIVSVVQAGTGLSNITQGTSGRAGSLMGIWLDAPMEFSSVNGNFVQFMGTNPKKFFQGGAGNKYSVRGGIGIYARNNSSTFGARCEFNNNEIDNCGLLNGGAQTAMGAPGVTGSGASGSTSYYYFVQPVGLAQYAVGISSRGSIASRPSTLTALNFNTITWTPVLGATSYNIYRGIDFSSHVAGLIGNTSSTSFVDQGQASTGVQPETLYNNDLCVGIYTERFNIANANSNRIVDIHSSSGGSNGSTRAIGMFAANASNNEMHFEGNYISTIIGAQALGIGVGDGVGDQVTKIYINDNTIIEIVGTSSTANYGGGDADVQADGVRVNCLFNYFFAHDNTVTDIQLSAISTSTVNIKPAAGIHVKVFDGAASVIQDFVCRGNTIDGNLRGIFIESNGNTSAAWRYLDVSHNDVSIITSSNLNSDVYFGIDIETQGFAVDQITCSSNRVYIQNQTTSQHASGIAISGGSGGHSMVVDGNSVWAQNTVAAYSTYGMTINGTNGAVVCNNSIYSNSSAGFARGLYVASIDTATINNNSIRGAGTGIYTQNVASFTINSNALNTFNNGGFNTSIIVDTCVNGFVTTNLVDPNGGTHEFQAGCTNVTISGNKDI